MRMMLTAYKFHHLKSCAERMETSIKKGGRELMDIETLNDIEIQSLRKYFQRKYDSYY